MKTLAAIHTVGTLVAPIQALCDELLPEVRLRHTADDRLIEAVIHDGGVTEATAARLTEHIVAAARAGADLILCTCSSVGEAAEAARDCVSVPVLRIDEAMARTAVSRAHRIGVLATLATTLGPTLRLLQRCAAAAGRDVKLLEGLAPQAFAAGRTGDRAVRDAARSLRDRVDLLVLAQGSMARLQPALAQDTGLPTLASPRLGIEHVKHVLLMGQRGSA